MPRLVHRSPKYRRHRASGQAIVTLDGLDHYLGTHGSKASRVEYDRLTGEWLANGRKLATSASDLTVAELIASYWRHAQTYYRKPDGTPTSEQGVIRLALRPVKEMYGATRAIDFGPLALKAVREEMIGYGWVRNQINKAVDRIRRVYKWGAAEQLLPASIHQSLRAVDGLRQGRSKAVESEPVRPVGDSVLAATVPHLSPVVRAMVELQLVTGMRRW